MSFMNFMSYPRRYAFFYSQLLFRAVHASTTQKEEGRLRCGCINVMIILKLKSVIKIDNEISLSSERKVEINVS